MSKEFDDRVEKAKNQMVKEYGIAVAISLPIVVVLLLGQKLGWW